jgi:hypothetical protein
VTPSPCDAVTSWRIHLVVRRCEWSDWKEDMINKANAAFRLYIVETGFYPHLLIDRMKSDFHQLFSLTSVALMGVNKLIVQS